MMKGYVSQNYGLEISQKRISAALKAVAPVQYNQRRTNVARQTNPIPYQADYFGHKLHVDQNEKLARYGVTHVVAIDGHSRFVTAGATMPIKNNIIIYRDVYRKSVSENGLFDQVRVDHGREFYLMLGVHEQLANFRNNRDISCYRQTQSKKNLPIERFWVEVNGRVNYPLKSVLVDMDNNIEIDMEDEVVKYCVSWVSGEVAKHGLNVCIQSWNHHPIAGRGVPKIIREATKHRIAIIDDASLPNPESAVAMYGNIYQGRLNDQGSFGTDPLNPFAQENRLRNYDAMFNNEYIFSNIVNGNPQPFKQAILFFISETRRLFQQQ